MEFSFLSKVFRVGVTKMFDASDVLNDNVSYGGILQSHGENNFIFIQWCEKVAENINNPILSTVVSLA